MNVLKSEINPIKVDSETFKMFKDWLRNHLKFGPVTVVFTKKDGTLRTMVCTTNEELIPKVPLEDVDNFQLVSPQKKLDPDNMKVYDLESQSWKSFRWNSVKEVRFEL